MIRHCDIQAWRVFVTVIRTGSISKASEVCEMAPSNISRLLSQLEKSLGNVVLFDRQYSPIVLTSTGQLAYEQAKHLLSIHDDFIEEVSEAKNPYSGIVRIGMPQSFFDRTLLDASINLRVRYPGIRIEVFQSGFLPPIQFFENGHPLDVVIGYGPDVSQTDVVQTLIGVCCSFPLVSPVYVRHFGMPKTKHDLKHHRLLLFDNCRVPSNAQFADGDANIIGKFHDCLYLPNNTSLMVAAVLGNGIHYGAQLLYSYQDIAKGNLIAVRHLWSFPDWHYYLFINPQSKKRKRVMMVVDLILEELRAKLAVANQVLEAESP